MAIILRTPVYQQAAMRRHTTVRIAIYALTLQAAFSLVSVTSFLVGYWGEWGQVFAAYPTKQRWLWLIAILWSVAALVSGAGLLRRLAWGRTLYVSAATVAGFTYFVLQPWPLALSAVPMFMLTGAILFSRLGARYLNDVSAAPVVRNKRTILASAVLVVSSLVFAVSYHAVLFRIGWATGLHRAGVWFLASLVGLVVGAFVLPKGARAWGFGLGLMVSVVIVSATVLGYLPYTPPIVRFLGAGYREYLLDIKQINSFQAVLSILALVMLRWNGVEHARRSHTWPDQH
ncbi:hypothetical protein [Ralstonia pseudosolanacearum]|uniref:hypothetical protein n=1 Tax=Ralstonia pseudosolanacearum TaxID=1310165 RepID=UPI001FF77F4B|nr:hypothetical protein [Ralstonia pseudosolanacearum]